MSMGPLTLTDTQDQACRAFLDLVMVQHQRSLDIPLEQLDTIKTMIFAAPPKLFKVLIGALNASTLFTLSDDLTAAKGIEWLQAVHYAEVDMLFSKFSLPMQRKLLGNLYATHPAVYARLKDCVRGKLIRIEGMFVTRVKWDGMVETRLDRIVAQFLDSSVAPADMGASAADLQRDFDWDDVMSIIRMLVADQRLLAVPLGTANEFRVHLKIHWFLDAFPGVLKPSEWTRWDQLVVDALVQMPDVNWVLKVLAQFPDTALDRIIGVIQQASVHSDSTVRNRANRLLNELRDGVDSGNFENVRLVLTPILANAREQL